MKKILSALCLALILFAGIAAPLSVQAAPDAADSGTVYSGDQFIYGRSFHLKAGDSLEGSLLAFGATITLDEGSTVSGDIVLFGSTLQAAGRMEGDLVSFGGSGSLASTALLDGSLTSVGDSIVVEDGAQINGETNVTAPGNFNFDFDNLTPGFFGTTWDNPLNNILVSLFRALALAALAMLVVLLFQRPTERIGDAMMKQPVVTWAIGLLTPVAVVIIALIMCLTLILIPFALLGVFLLVASFLFGYLALGYEIGRRLIASSKAQWAPAVTAGVGTLILGLVTFAIDLIPCAGFIFNFFIVLVLGLGGVVSTLFGTRDVTTNPVFPINSVPPAAPQPPAQPPAEPQA